MYRKLLFLIPLFVSLRPAAMANAIPVMEDPFGNTASSCANASCDVIGGKSDFDLEKAAIVITPAWTSLTFYLNFHNPTLAPWSVPRSGGSLNVDTADIFLNVNGSSYAIPVYSRDYPGSKNFYAGSVYRIGNGVHSLTSNQALKFRNSPKELSHWTWRENQPVWAGGNGAGKSIANGSVNITNHGNGASAALYAVNIHFITPALWNIRPGDHIGVTFYSAISANDILNGTVEASAVPEPSTTLLWGTVAGVLALAIAKRRKARHQRV
jgi:hypothetical protein